MISAERVLREQKTEENRRSNFENQWQEIADVLWPGAADMFWTSRADKSVGHKNTELMYDATSAIALDRHTSILASMMVPQGSKWHRLRTTSPELNRERDVAEWYDTVTDILFRVRQSPNSGFYPQMNKAFKSIGAFGTGVVFVDLDPPSPTSRGGWPRYRDMHMSGTYLRENYQGQIDTAFIKGAFTHRQAQQMVDAGIFEKLPKKVDERIKKNSEEQHTYIHYIGPNEDFDPGVKGVKGMAFEEAWVCQDTNEVIGRGGYRVFPLPNGRPSVTPGEVYGRGPAMLVLPNIKVLNQQKKSHLKVGHQLADPTLLAHDDGIVDTFSLRPGFVNAGGLDSQGRKLVQPLLENRGQVNQLKELMDDERSVINDAFLVHLFQILLDTPRMTATEVLDNARQRSMLLSPTMAPLQSGFLGGMIEREIDLLVHANRLPEMPPVLLEAQNDAGLEIEYDNPLSRLMRSEEAAGISRWTEQLLQAVQITQDPAPLDHVDWDTAAPELADINAVPKRWVADEAQIAEKRQQRNAAQAVDTAIQAGPSVAALLKEGAGGQQ